MQNHNDPIPNPSPQREGSSTAPASAVGVLPLKGELEGVCGSGDLIDTDSNPT